MGAATSKTSVVPSPSMSSGQSSLPKYEPIWRVVGSGDPRGKGRQDYGQVGSTCWSGPHTPDNQNSSHISKSLTKMLLNFKCLKAFAKDHIFCVWMSPISFARYASHREDFHSLFQLLLVFGAFLPSSILHKQVSCCWSFILKKKLLCQTVNKENLHKSRE